MNPKGLKHCDSGTDLDGGEDEGGDVEITTHDRCRLTSEGERPTILDTDPRELRNGMASGSGGLQGSVLPGPSHTLCAFNGHTYEW